MGMPPSRYPPLYWRPELGVIGITPENIGLLTPPQLYQAVLATRRSRAS